MKKTIFITSLILLSAIPSYSVPAFAGTVTFNTYYPSPFGAYDRLQLVPRAQLADPCTPGTLYVEDNGGNGTLHFCSDSTWGTANGPWTQQLGLGANNIFPTVTTNPLAAAVKIGIGTTTPQFKLTLATDGGILAMGQPASGESLPNNLGAGSRLIWYPRKSSFRAGNVDGTQWDDSNIASVSIAMGYNTIANGSTAVAMGSGTTASGSGATALGTNTIADGQYSTTMGHGTHAGNGTTDAILAPTAMGWNTNASGNYSTAMGQLSQAEGISSTAMGYNTRAAGEDSTAMGANSQALGNTSTAIGYNSGTAANAQYAIAMGDTAQASGADSIAIGYNATANAARSMAIGIGTARADAIDSIAIGGGGLTVSGSNSIGIGIGGTITQGNTIALMSTQVGINKPDPSYTLDVNGNIRANGWTSNSDLRLKKNIFPISNALSKITQLRGVNYYWKNETTGKGPQIGLIAQDVEKIFPEIVSTDKEGYKSLDYSRLVSPLIEAVKELKAENEELKKRIEVLEKDKK